MTILALASMERLGVEDPQRHVVVVLGRDVIGPLNGTIPRARRTFLGRRAGPAARAGQRAGGRDRLRPGRALHRSLGRTRAGAQRGVLLPRLPPRRLSPDRRPAFLVLFSLLLVTGVGSLLSARARDPRRAVMSALGVALLLIAASAYALQPLLRHLIDLPFGVRVVIAVAIMAPFGVTLGMAMPIGLRRLEQLEPAAVPYAWGVNAIASVIASVLGVAVAIRLGFPAASLLACACYAAAFAQAARGEWPAGRVP